MLRPLTLVALVAGGVAAGLATAAVAFRPDSTDSIEVRPVVASSQAPSSFSTTSAPAPADFPDGLAVGPDGTAPELVIVDHAEPEPMKRTRASAGSNAAGRTAPVENDPPEATPDPAILDSEPVELAASESDTPDLAEATRSVRITPEDAAEAPRGGTSIGDVDRGDRGRGGIRISVSGADCRPGSGAATFVNRRGPGLGVNGGFRGGF